MGGFGLIYWFLRGYITIWIIYIMWLDHYHPLHDLILGFLWGYFQFIYLFIFFVTHISLMLKDLAFMIFHILIFWYFLCNAFGRLFLGTGL
jgi:hypothetical protein